MAVVCTQIAILEPKYADNEGTQCFSLLECPKGHGDPINRDKVYVHEHVAGL